MKLKIPTNPSKKWLYEFLEEQYAAFNRENAVSSEFLDPLLIAREFRSEKVALVCALFAYGNVRAILKFLESLPLESLQDSNFNFVESQFLKPYRFQNKLDIFIFFKILSRLESLESIFMQGYKNGGILGGIANLQNAFYDGLESLGIKATQGLEFLLGKKITKDSTSPLKRWNLFLRWMVRNDFLDLGLWSGINRADLLLPLDTHTFRVTQRLGLLKRKSYDFKAVCEVSERLREFDKSDPIKYDFALYRIGQLGLVEL